jgi:hypothetical protein
VLTAQLIENYGFPLSFVVCGTVEKVSFEKCSDHNTFSLNRNFSQNRLKKEKCMQNVITFRVSKNENPQFIDQINGLLGKTCYMDFTCFPDFEFGNWSAKEADNVKRTIARRQCFYWDEDSKDRFVIRINNLGDVK